MVSTRGIGRIGTLAAGLGVGAAVAASPGIAAADSSSTWWSSLDSLLSATTPSDANLAISFDGMNLLTASNAVATTTAGEYGLAIAYGDGAAASAAGGSGDFAFASGTSALADAGGSTSDTASNNDVAIDIGSNTNSDYSGAFAGDGNDDTALDIGTNSGIDASGAQAVDGNNDLAFVIGPANSSAIAGGDDAGFGGGFHGGGFGDDGNNDVAYVLDPFGATASNATAGNANDDLAAVLFTHNNATAQGTDYLYDVVSALSHESGTLPTFLSSLLTDFSSLF